MNIKLTIRHLGVAIGVIAVVLVFFAPRLWLVAEENPGTFVWDRGTTFLAQCEDPFRTDVEPAMKWRLAPALTAYALNLPGRMAFIIPWFGVIALLGFVSNLFWCRSQNWRFTVAGTLIVGTTSAVMVPLHWFGVNDGWVWLGLLAMAFCKNRSCLIVALLLVPWVDERFIIGLPLALATRALAMNRSQPRLEWWPLLWLLPYSLIRISLGGNPLTGETESSFITDHLHESLKLFGLAPLAWWMGLRLAWAPIIYLGTTLQKKHLLWLLGVLIPTAVVTVILAADMSRSAAIILPLAALGLIRFYEDHQAVAERYAMWTAVVALVMPTVHVVGRKIDPVENLLIELIRLF